jgi:2-polyprenyl-6-methoxyphenol hydroxylase-like FAD-dependent oxidoreductase
MHRGGGEMKQKTEVLIAGAGPVGLLTAISLHRKGVRFEVYDSDRRTGTRSFALALHPGSLRLLDSLGLAAPLIAEGEKIERLAFYEGSARRAVLDFSELQTDFPYVLVIAQNSLERELQEYLHRNKVKIHWNHRIQSFEESREGVEAEIHQIDRVTLGYPIAMNESVITKTLEVEASFLVGADGYFSRIRNLLGVESAKFGDPLTFYVSEFESAARAEREIRVALTQDSANVLWPMKGNRLRWSFQIDPSEHGTLTEDSLGGFVRDRAPWFTELPTRVHWSTQVTFERRLAERFGEGRAWLVGDSAHIASPVGVQSMNVGLREASDLADHLVAALRGTADLESFETYESQREAEWRRLLGTGGLAWEAGVDEWVTRRGTEILPCIPASGGDLEALLGQIGLKLRQP